MLASLYIGLRFMHFLSLMLVFGSTLFTAKLSPAPIQRILTRRMNRFLPLLLTVNAVSAIAIFAVQGGMMGNGWPDTLRPAIWLAVAQTQFGQIWQWQILLAIVTLTASLLKPRAQGLLLLLIIAQLMLQAAVGHAAMREGMPGWLQRLNHALHLLCAAAWFGGLLPVIVCTRLAQGRWRTEAIITLMRFSRYGHVAVAGVILTGAINTFLIQGAVWPWQSEYGRLLIAKGALVGVMLIAAVVNRYVLVPRFRTHGHQAYPLFIRLTQAEVISGVAVLALVSLFATLEPY